MPVTPQITVSGSVADLFGAAEPGSLVVQLCGYGSQLPRVSGTALIGQTAPLPIDCTGGDYDFELWGTDVISPSGTFYTVTVIDANNNVVQINAYQFSGTETVDLSSETPYNPPPPVPPGFRWIFDEVPTPPIDDSGNDTFTLSEAPNPPSSLNFFKNGSRMTDGIGITLSGATITYEPDYIPEDGDSHIAAMYLVYS
jgi:hypothetical protein